MGLERVIYFLNLEGIDLGTYPAPQLYQGTIGDIKADAYKLVKSLRDQGLTVETDYLDKSVKAQMKYANKLGAEFVIILGEDEMASGKVKIKKMADGTEQEISIDDIYTAVAGS